MTGNRNGRYIIIPKSQINKKFITNHLINNELLKYFQTFILTYLKLLIIELREREEMKCKFLAKISIFILHCSAKVTA